MQLLAKWCQFMTEVLNREKKLSGKADLAHILDGHLHVTELEQNTK